MQMSKKTKSHPELSDVTRLKQLNAAYPELANINDECWIKTIENARILSVEPGTMLFNGSNDCNNFMLIIEGTVRIYQTAEDGREITLYRVEAGNLCILSLNSLLKKQSFNAIASTESLVKALVINSENFKEMLNKVEIFRDFVLTTITERLCDTIYLIQDTAFNHLNMRLACMLGSLFERNQGPSVKITHQELAFELGTTREVISRILKEFEKQKCVELSRGRIKLASAEGLEWFSQPV